MNKTNKQNNKQSLMKISVLRESLDSLEKKNNRLLLLSRIKLALALIFCSIIIIFGIIGVFTSIGNISISSYTKFAKFIILVILCYININIIISVAQLYNESKQKYLYEVQEIKECRENIKNMISQQKQN